MGKSFERCGPTWPSRKARSAILLRIEPLPRLHPLERGVSEGEASALPQLVKHDHWDYHVHAAPPDAPLAGRMAVEAAMAFADVIRSGELDRLRRCAATHCDDVLVDLSKNRSRRFCSLACANRTNVAAYRTRRAAATP